MIPKLSHRTFANVVSKKFESCKMTLAEKVMFAIKALEVFAEKKEPIPVVVDSWETMSVSKASDAIGEENFALCNVKDMIAVLDYNAINDKVLAEAYFNALIAATARVYFYGLDFKGRIYKVSHFSASGRGRGEGIFVTEENEGAIMHLINHWETEFAGQTVTAWWKVKMNVASSQRRISTMVRACDGCSTDNVRIGMRNILFVKGLHEHFFHVGDVREIGWFEEGAATYDTVSNPVDDGAGWIDIDAVEKIFGVRIEKADLQGRGWDLKYTVEVSHPFSVLEKIGKGKFIENALTGELVPIEELADRGYCVLMPMENIKYGDLKKNPGKYPMYPCGLADDELWICAAVSESDDLKMTIKDSRQMLVPLQGLRRDEVERLVVTKRLERIKDENEYEEYDEYIPGFSTSTSIKKRRQDVYRAERHELEFGRSEENGCYPFCSWEMLPQMADLVVTDEKIEGQTEDWYRIHGRYKKALNYMDFRSMHGLQVMIGAVKTKTVLVSRFPNIERHFLFAKNMAHFDGDELLELEKSLHCRNTLVMSLDFPARDVLKADCDGDTPKVEYPKTVEEDMHILSHYDWDMMYVPTAVTAQKVSFEDFCAIQAVEKTVSDACMQRLAKLNAAK